MRRQSRTLSALIYLLVLVSLFACAKQVTDAQLSSEQADEIIRNLDVINERAELRVTLVIVGLLILGFATPLLMPCFPKRRYTGVSKRCLIGAILGGIVGLVTALVFALVPSVWKWVGIPPEYVQIVVATTNPSEKSNLTHDQVDHAIAMRQRSEGTWVSPRGRFAIENPILVIIELAAASIIGAFLAYLVHMMLPTMLSKVQGFRRKTAPQG